MPVSFLHTHPAKAEPNSLRYRLHKHLNFSRPGRDPAVLHASDMTGDKYFCGRQRVIMNLKGMQPTVQYINMSTRAVYEFGDDVERRAVAWFAEAGMAVGNWICPCSKTYFMCHRPILCVGCGARGRTFRYDQRRFASATSHISCGVDLFVSGMGPKLRIVEIKSAMKEDFVKILGPMAEHRERTNLYMHCVETSADSDKDKIDTTVAHVFYVCKGGYVKDEEVSQWKFGDGGFTPIKDYEIPRDNDMIAQHISTACEYQIQKQNKVIPQRICCSSGDKPAKGCPVVQDCWGSKFPAGSKWA
jgi:hypothetical protein